MLERYERVAGALGAGDADGAIGLLNVELIDDVRFSAGWRIEVQTVVDCNLSSAAFSR